MMDESKPLLPVPHSLRPVEMQGLVEKLKQRYGDKEVLPTDFDFLSRNLRLDVKRPEHVVSGILVVTSEQSPLLLAVDEESSFESKGSYDREALAYVRLLARKLHAALQVSCPYPMSVLSLVVSLQEKDPNRKIEEAVSEAFTVQPLARLMMTPDKFERIRTAVEKEINKSAVLEDSDKDERKSGGGEVTSVEAVPKEKAFPVTLQSPQEKLKMVGASPTQDSGSGTSSKLCGDCRRLDLHQFDLNTVPLQLCVDEKSPVKKMLQIFDRTDFLNDVLIRVCAARNTPSIIDSPKKGPLRWRLLIHIRNASPAESYASALEEKMSDRVKSMSMGPIISENFCIDKIYDEAEVLCFLSVTIVGAFECVVAKDFHSPQGLSHSLLEADLDCIVHLLFCRTDVSYHMPTRPQELEDKSNGAGVLVQECVSIRFESPKEKASSDPDIKEYIDRLWKDMSEPLGKYISAFAKNRTGGAFYCGLREDKGKNKIQALDLPDRWKKEIEEEIQKKIKEDMLWVRRDPENDRGYAVLKPGDIEKGRHFDVAFIPVKDPKRKNHNLCILEVKVASFDGVVFNDGGPEVYVFEKKEEEGRDVYHPVPVAARDWLEKLQQHAWCSRHRKPRQRQLCCDRYDRCSNYQKVPPQRVVRSSRSAVTPAMRPRLPNRRINEVPV